MKIPKTKTLKYIAISLGVVIVVLLCALIFVPAPDRDTAPKENYVASPDGRVQITDPTADEAITSPVVISGSVTGGGWFFEGVFPIQVVDADGTVLGSGQASSAQGEWTSTGTVLFSGIVPFSTPRFQRGMVVFSKDNPSGLPRNNESFSVPVRFE
jgi:hypothetical protein